MLSSQKSPVFHHFHDSPPKNCGLFRESISENCSTAPITDRQVAMLDFAKKISQTAHLVGEKDFDLLKKFGLVEEDIWDIVGISTFFGMSNRVANISNMLGDATFSSLRH